MYNYRLKEELLDEIAAWFQEVVDEFDKLPELPLLSRQDEYWDTLGDRLTKIIKKSGPSNTTKGKEK